MAGIWFPDAAPASAGAEDDEFADNSGGVPGGWTEVDHGTFQTVTEDEGGLNLLEPTHAGDGIAGIYKSIPAGDFTYWTKVSLSGLAETNHVVGGIALWADATSSAADLVLFDIVCNATAGIIEVTNWNQYNSFNASPSGSQPITVDVGPTHIYLRVRRTGTTYAFDFSSDGITWQRLYSTASLFVTPTHIGPMVNNVNTGADVAARYAFWRYLNSDVGITGLVGGDRIVFQKTVDVSGATATTTADVFAPSIETTAGPTVVIAGEVASAQAAVSVPVVETVRSVSIVSTVADGLADTVAAEVLAGIVEVAAGVAQATAAAQIEWVAAQKSATVAGELAQATANALAATIFALGPSVLIDFEDPITFEPIMAAAQAAVLAPDAVNNNPAIEPPVVSATAAILAVNFPPMITPDAPASATADMRPADVRALRTEAPLGSGGSPAGLNFGACTIDFAIDGIVLDAQPYSIQREQPKHEIRPGPRGYRLTSTRHGRAWAVQFGETLVDTVTVSELRERVGSALMHRWTWTEPDSTPIDIEGALTEIEFRHSQQSPRFYEPITFRIRERQQ